LKIQSMAMAGHPGAATLLAWVRELVQPRTTESGGGFLIVPERAENNEESARAMMLYSEAHQLEPGSEEWQRKNGPRTPPKPKPVLDPSSPLAMALQEFKQKWASIPYVRD
jgi:hypothetical protein